MLSLLAPLRTLLEDVVHKALYMKKRAFVDAVIKGDDALAVFEVFFRKAFGEGLIENGKLGRGDDGIVLVEEAAHALAVVRKADGVVFLRIRKLLKLLDDEV